MFVKIHDEYCRQVSNPFYVIDGPIGPKSKFVEGLQALNISTELVE